MSILGILIYIALIVLIIAGQWKMYEKAGQPGWACIVPIYNIIVLLRIVRKPAWWFLLLLIPIVNFVFLIIIYIELAKAFGKDGGFAVGLIFLSFIFIPILGFGDAQYQYGDNNNSASDPNVLDS